MDSNMVCRDLLAGRCVRCGDCAESGEPLCGVCAILLAHEVLSAGQDPDYRACRVCGGRIGLTEARVLRYATNRRVGNSETPKLCWVCERLHLSAHANAGAEGEALR